MRGQTLTCVGSLNDDCSTQTRKTHARRKIRAVLSGRELVKAVEHRPCARCRERSIRSICATVALVALICTGFGCSTRQTPRVTFRSTETGKAYSQHFGHAVYQRSDSGQVQIVMIDQGLDAPRTPRGQALQPATAPPLKQVIAMRVLWRPTRAVQAEDLTSTNAAIDWYVVSEDSFDGNGGSSADLLHYQGTGLVRVNEKGDTATVEVTDATLELTARAGNLQDPLGRTSLSASIRADRDDALVASTLQDLRERFEARRATEANQGPPPRAPSGP